MAHAKYQGLADQVRKQRLAPFLAKSQKEIHCQQIAFPFAQERVEIFHQFDPEEREIQWSYYSESGEFLMQFGFCLKTHKYEVEACHPGLWLQEKPQYLQAIQETLANHYPPLELVKKSNGVIEIEKLEVDDTVKTSS